jgi:transcriptional regulator
MYIPKHFEITDETEISKFIEANSFGQLISLIDTAILSTQIPFFFDTDSGVLLDHMAKANPQWQQVQKQKILVTLPGEHAYVSPSWYESAGVLTWNYQAVHIEGIVESFTDPEKLKRVVDTLTEQNESGHPNPWQPDYADSMLHGIIGIEISITSIECKFKLSQNRRVQD